uniref:UPAR/Ly6 domain-containing protein n=1 Tax=Cyprinus carpio TaxID=7962 RepID=A0A8C2Q7P2_CYPCA
MHIVTPTFLFSFAVNALKCYVCGSATTNQECNKSEQDCQAPLDTCMTTVGTLGEQISLILKQLSTDMGHTCCN